MRGRQHVCVIIPGQRAMMLTTLRFADELLPPAKLTAATPKSSNLTAGERTMAKKLVDEMTSPWKPQQFHDSYREDLMRRIRTKIKKKQTHSPASEPEESARPKAQVIDLMDALKSSLKLRTKHGARQAAAGAKRRRA